MEYRLSELSIYEPGQMKGPHGEPQQEDCLYPIPGYATPQSRVFVVCDGMGGIGVGDVAASEVCRTLGSLIDNPEKPFNNDYLTKAIVKAYNAIDLADRGHANIMGTTMAMLRLSDQGALIAHIGNSRVYHLRPGATEADTEIIYCTEDHTLANKERHEGEALDPQSNPNVDKNKVLTRVMLSHAKRRCAPHVHTSSDVRSGDYFLLCTDGLLERLTDTDIRAIFSHSGGSDPDKRILLQQAAALSKDNYTAIIVHIIKVTQTDASQEPASFSIPASMHTAAPAHVSAPHEHPSTDSHNHDSDSERSKNDKPMKKEKASNKKGKFALKISAKTLLYIMGALAVIMVAYSLFIRTDEVLQPAGIAIDAPSAAPSSNEESYGYEITEQDIRNEAQQIAPETVPEEEIEPEIEPEEEATQTGEPEAPSEPEPMPNEPMLQE